MVDLQDMILVSPAQVRAARLLVGWSPDRLAYHGNCTRPKVDEIERGDGTDRQAVGQLANALDAEGVRFDVDGAGVRMKRPAV